MYVMIKSQSFVSIYHPISPMYIRHQEPVSPFPTEHPPSLIPLRKERNLSHREIHTRENIRITTRTDKKYKKAELEISTVAMEDN